MTKRDKILNRIKGFATSTDPHAEIYLYGSQARGDARRLSDWDLLILLNRANVPFTFETSLMDQLYEIELETGEVISPMIYAKKEWEDGHSFTPLYENIKREGIRIQ